VNGAVEPDLVASVTDLSTIADGSIDAVWSAHCVEHLYAHEVPLALAEFHRVLNATGFACIIVPDLQSIAEWVANDRLDEPIYDSSAGPVTAHDMLWGFGPAIADGDVAMAHRCGFTPTLFLERLRGAKFAEIALRRRSNLELAALALREDSGSHLRRESLLQNLDL
jgi:SAM-dependent methyltransferase